MNQIKLYFLTGFLGSGKTNTFKESFREYGRNEMYESFRMSLEKSALTEQYYRMMTFTW